VRGAVLDVAVDVRDGSPTERRHVARELTAEGGEGLFIPMGVAHGFQSLVDDTLVLYLMSDHHAPGLERGYAHDDPAFGIDWPLPVTEISERDAAFAHLEAP
jgi:dTDP-4-dehydrorhamnose 3,5-epimerase